MGDVCCPEQIMNHTSAKGLHLPQEKWFASEVSFIQDVLTQDLYAIGQYC